MSVQLYRGSSVGLALTDALDELVTGGMISPSMALKFDKAMHDTLSNSVQSTAAIKANLHTYRFCDNVWTFFLEDATFTLTLPGDDSETVHIKKAKIVAVACPT